MNSLLPFPLHSRPTLCPTILFYALDTDRQLLIKMKNSFPKTILPPNHSSCPTIQAPPPQSRRAVSVVAGNKTKGKPLFANCIKSI